MQRILPETDLERKLMCTAAVFIEENRVLDDLYEVVAADLTEGQELTEDSREHVLGEVGEFFFRLDMNYGPDIQADCIEILEDFWKVFDKATALKVLEDVRTQGHRTKFNVLQKCLPSEGGVDSVAMDRFKQIFTFDLPNEDDLQMTDEDFTKLANWMQKTYKYLGDGGILAWDMARGVHLARLAFVAGYLDDNEAWAEILKWAPFTEGHFSSWTEFSQSFLIGRTFWSGVDDPQIKETCQHLLGHPASPWNFLHWSND